jgi:hypothetical protein
MSYASGGLIQATDFNTRVASVNQLWGTGSGNYGYGQSTTVATNSAGSIVPATDWATLIARMQSMQQHQFNNTAGVPAQPTSGSIITYLSTVDTAITSLQNNRFTVYTTSSTNYASTSNSTTWHTSSVKTFTITFGSDNQARYFFNCGGWIQVVSNGNTITPATWNSFVNTGFASYVLYATSSTHQGTVGTYTRGTYLSGSGYFNLTSTPTTFLSMTETGTGNANYNANAITVAFSYNGAGVITATLTLLDNDSNTFGYTNTGTTNCSISLGFPETTYLSNTWGAGTTVNSVNTQA